MRFLLIVNTATHFSPFAANVAKFISANTHHEVVIYLTCKAAEQQVASRLERLEGVRIVRRNDIFEKALRADLTDYASPSWRDFYTSWDRKVLHYRTLAPEAEFLSSTFRTTSKIVDYAINMFEYDAVIHEAPENMLAFFAKKVADSIGVRYIGLSNSRIPNRTDVADNWFTNSKYTSVYNEKLDEEEVDRCSLLAMEFAEERLSRDINKLDHVTAYKTSLVKRYLSRIRLHWNDRLSLLRTRKELIESFDYESLSVLHSTFRFPLRSFQRKARYKSFVKKLTVPTDEQLKQDDYYVFPMHFQPEASTSAQATYFCDLENTARNTAFSILFPSKFLLKEHPHAVGLTPKSFYRKVSLLPNCEVISPFTNNISLHENSRGVITLTSTLGLQAAILGKPVYVLGNVFYDFHPNVKKVVGFEELNNVLMSDQFSPLSGDALRDANARFFHAYLVNTLDVYITEYDKNKSKNYRSLLKRIEELCT